MDFMIPISPEWLQVRSGGWRLEPSSTIAMSAFVIGLRIKPHFQAYSNIHRVRQVYRPCKRNTFRFSLIDLKTPACARIKIQAQMQFSIHWRSPQYAISILVANRIPVRWSPKDTWAWGPMCIFKVTVAVDITYKNVIECFLNIDVIHFVSPFLLINLSVTGNYSSALPVPILV